MLEDFKFGKISLTDFIILFLPNFIGFNKFYIFAIFIINAIYLKYLFRDIYASNFCTRK